MAHFITCSKRLRLPAALLAAALCTSAWAAPQGGEALAVWTPKKLEFVYFGFTTKFSCDGLRDKIRGVLLDLGARKDVQVDETPCPGLPDRPMQFPGVTIKMNVLEPIEKAKPAQGEHPIPAHWKSVEVLGRESPLDRSGQCELIEQIKQRILPLFTVRNVQFSSNCVPYQANAGGAQLSAQVLSAGANAER